MLTDEGLIVRAGEAGSDPFYKNSPFIKFFELNDGYHGQLSRAVKPGEQFEILHAVGTKEYRKIVQRIIGERVDAAMDAQGDVDLLHAYMKLKE